MPYTLPDLLLALGARPGLYPDNADPAAFFDQATGTTWMSEVRMEAADRLLCALAQVPPGGPQLVLAEVRVLEDNGLWHPNACTVTGKRVPADPDAVLALFSLVRMHIRVGIAPDFDQALLDFTGLRLPITGYR